MAIGSPKPLPFEHDRSDWYVKDDMMHLKAADILDIVRAN